MSPMVSRPRNNSRRRTDRASFTQLSLRHAAALVDNACSCRAYPHRARGVPRPRMELAFKPPLTRQCTLAVSARVGRRKPADGGDSPRFAGARQTKRAMTLDVGLARSMQLRWHVSHHRNLSHRPPPRDARDGLRTPDRARHHDVDERPDRRSDRRERRCRAAGGRDLWSRGGMRSRRQRRALSQRGGLYVRPRCPRADPDRALDLHADGDARWVRDVSGGHPQRALRHSPRPR